MKLVIPFLMLFSSVLWLSAQDIREVYVVKSIGLSDHDNFQDLIPLKEAIGDSRIIELADWGSANDGASYDAMNRVIRFLHTELSFDVIIWPLGVFEGLLMDRAFIEGNVEEGLKTTYRVWRESQSFADLARFISEGHPEDPMIMMGGSCQFHAYSKEIIMNFLREQTRLSCDENFDFGIIDQIERIWNSARRLKSLGENDLNILESYVEDLIEVLKDSEWNEPLMPTILDNLKWFIELEKLRANTPPGEVESVVQKFIDKSNSKNLAEIFNSQGTNRKYILFGSWQNLRNQFKEEIYTIGFTSHHGQIARPGQEPEILEDAEGGSIEAYLHNLRKPFLFAETKDLNFVNKPSRLDRKTRSTWREEMDALFFTDQAYPSLPLEKSSR